MERLNIAIIGCGTVGGGVAKILTEIRDQVSINAGKDICLKTIVELSPKTASERFQLPIELFCGDGRNLSNSEADRYVQDLIASKEIDLIVETIGGTSDYVYNLSLSTCKAGKHLVTANKALLAEKGTSLFETAKKNNVAIGFEAAVCGAIPIVKAIKENFTGDEILSISGIMNGTSNYILSMMQNENLDFETALKLAQQKGYAEADPTLDISGGDAGHKLKLLIKLSYGLEVSTNQLSIHGIEDVKKEDIDFANEIGCKIKLIAFAKKIDGELFATVCPMMVKNSNLLSGVDGATNAIKIVNRYSGKHFLIGSGAGSLETASSIVSDIVFIARYGDKMKNDLPTNNELKFVDAKHFVIPYIVTFHTGDFPGTTGFITTAIGNQNINIETISHNRHNENRATFSVVTTPCTLDQIENSIAEIKSRNPQILMSAPKIIPVLY